MWRWEGVGFADGGACCDGAVGWGKPAGIEYQGRWPGYDADLKYSAGTTYTSNSSSESCVANPDPLVQNWTKIFVKKDKSFDTSTLTILELEKLRRKSVREYQSLLGISDYDVSGFQKGGGKMITYHSTVCSLFSSFVQPLPSYSDMSTVSEQYNTCNAC